MPSSLENAVMHAISFLTAPLIDKHDPRTIDALHSALMLNLTSFYAPTWSESNPALGSSQRVLSFSPENLPPSPVWRSARMVGLLWTPWIAALGNFAFDLCVDPGCVAFKIGAWGSVHIIWQESPSVFTMKRKTLAQSIIDDEENAIFDLIDHELAFSNPSSGPSYQSSTVSSTSSATWMAPLLDRFPVPSSSNSALRTSPSILAASISRSSSRASMISSSGFSFSSAETSDSYGSMSSFSSSRSSLDLPQNKPSTAVQPTHRSRRSRPRIPNVFVDGSKKEVTNYDGGKTTVLTGGVMLGNPTKVNKPRSERW